MHDNQVRALTQDDLQIVVGGGSLLPIPPYHGGPIASPVVPPPNHKLPPIVPLPMPVITV